MSVEKTACFIGHRKIDETNELKEKIYSTIEDLIVNKGVTIFLFGSRSQFDELCKKIVTKLKEKYPHIKRIYVRAEYEFISQDYRDYLLESCEETYYSPKISGAGKSVYVERNQIMIDKSDYCIFYYDKNYLPPRYNKTGCDYKPKSGTHSAYNYAVRKKKLIINLVTATK